jgi:hypothetical protein
LKLVEQLHEQARMELNKQIHERTQENAETTAHIIELTTKLVRQTFCFFMRDIYLPIDNSGKRNATITNYKHKCPIKND